MVKGGGRYGEIGLNKRGRDDRAKKRTVLQSPPHF